MLMKKKCVKVLGFLVCLNCFYGFIFTEKYDLGYPIYTVKQKYDGWCAYAVLEMMHAIKQDDVATQYMNWQDKKDGIEDVNSVRQCYLNL